MYIHNHYLFRLIQKFPFLSKLITATDGYIPEEENEDDFIFGAGKLGKSVLVPDGNWVPYRPQDEMQIGRFVETMGCTGYALLNCLEMIARKKYGITFNKSDRFTNKMSGCSKNGNNMSTVIDSVRKHHGVVKETTWPWDKQTFTWEKYYASIPNNIQELGKAFLNDFEIGYERVSTNKQLIKEALKYSPLYVAGYAWYKQNGLYRSYGRANHAFTIVRALNDRYYAYDSYSPFIKELDPNFLFGAIFLITLNKKQKKYNQAEINRLMAEGKEYIIRPDSNGEFYKLTNEGLKFIPDIKQVADDIAQYMKVKPENVNEMLKFLTQIKKIKWVDERYYNKLYN